MKALQSDPSVSETLKTVVTAIVDMLEQQSLNNQVVESELADKIGSFEMQQALSQKLSLKEFA